MKTSVADFYCPKYSKVQQNPLVKAPRSLSSLARISDSEILSPRSTNCVPDVV